ncbi:MAG: phosphate/phosphite/phosphonate ABC transporter substrate-binding protein [Candidatus Omnitrophota bacterium]
MLQNRFIAGLAVLSLFICLYGCGKSEELRVIDLNDTIELEAMKTVDGEAVLNICVGSMITPEEGYAYYKRLLDYIGEKLAMKIRFIEKRTYAEVNALLESGDIDVAFVCGGPYVEGHDRFGLELLAAPLVNGKPLYYSYIIVPKESDTDSFEKLRGKVFAFVDPMSNTGNLVPRSMLQSIGETPENFFSEFMYTYSHDHSIKAVAQGIVDGAAVDSLIWDYLDKKGSRNTNRTRKIHVSKPYGIPPVVSRPGLDAALKERIRSVLLNMHTTPDGTDILGGMFIERFVPIDDSNYETIRRTRSRIEDAGGS